MTKPGRNAEDLAVRDELEGQEPVREDDGLTKEQLRKVYSRLFKRPDKAETYQELKRLCDALDSPTPSDVDKAIDSLGANGAILSANQKACLRAAFKGSTYEVMRPYKASAPMGGGLKAEQEGLAVVYHALLGSESDELAALYLHLLKAIARLNRPLEFRVSAMKEQLLLIFRQNAPAGASVTGIDDAAINQMIVMFELPSFSEVEPYEGGGSCVVGEKEVKCY